jgi:NADPH:quinone reductase-like Zn-dependent oxidoreductase
MSRIVRVHGFGGPDVLRIDDVELGDPKPGDVRVNVRAIGLNRVDALFRSGQFGKPPLPAMIGYEAAGVVEALGKDVKGFVTGDRVAVIPGPCMGTYGETIDYPADFIIRIPDDLSFEAAAATWMQYLTAYALIELAHVGSDDMVVITAASSSVGLAAIQIANAAKAIPVAVTRGGAKQEALKQQGAGHVIVTAEQGIADGVRQITNGRGARVVFDAVAGSTFPGLVNAAAPEGVIVVYGSLGGEPAILPANIAMLKHLTIHGFSTRYIIDDVPRRARAVDFVLTGLASGALRPVIDRVFAFDDIADAHRYLEANAQVGKIVVKVP